MGQSVNAMNGREGRPRRRLLVVEKKGEKNARRKKRSTPRPKVGVYSEGEPSGDDPLENGKERN